jgi:hypothetical protein
VEESLFAPSRQPTHLIRTSFQSFSAIPCPRCVKHSSRYSLCLHRSNEAIVRASYVIRMTLTFELNLFHVKQEFFVRRNPKSIFPGGSCLRSTSALVDLPTFCSIVDTPTLSIRTPRRTSQREQTIRTRLHAGARWMHTLKLLENSGWPTLCGLLQRVGAFVRFFSSSQCLLKSYLRRTFSKKPNARGSCDCPSQNIACLRTSGLRLFSAT